MKTSLAELLQKAISYHQAGDLLNAESSYLEVLSQYPASLDATHNLGMLKVQLGNFPEALNLLQAALLGDSFRSQYWISYINTLIASGQPHIARDALSLGLEYGLKGEVVNELTNRLNLAVIPVSDEFSASTMPIMKGVSEPSVSQKEHLVHLLNCENYPEAEQLARTICKTHPSHGFGWKILGVLLVKLEKNEEAREALEKALTLSSNDPEIYHSLGLVLMNLGMLDQAISRFDRAITLKPDYVEAYSNQGNAQKKLGRIEDAIESYASGIRIKPDMAEIHFNLGTALHESGKLNLAMQSYKKTIELRPDFAEAHFNLGGVLKGLKEFDGAIGSYQKAITINPSYSEAYFNLGFTQKETGQLKNAMKSFSQAIVINPEYADAHNMLGIVFYNMGLLNESVQSYNRAIEIRPNYAPYRNNLGLTLHDIGDHEVVIATYRKALEIDPDYADVHNNLALTLYELGQHDEALQLLKRAISLNPEQAEAYCNYGTVLRDMGEIDQAISNFEIALKLRPDYEDAYNALLFSINYHPELSAEAIFEYYQAYQTKFVQPYGQVSYTNKPKPKKKLKIGYVAATFHHHSCRHFLQPLIENHNRSKFELFAYAHLAKNDALTEMYKSHFDHWVPTRGMGNEELAERIRADGIDILVDIAGHTAGNRLQVFARKPAPVSLHWLDFGYTTGLQAIDYYLTDKPTIPEGSEHLFSETPWRLPTPAYAYRPAEGMGEVNQLPALERGYITFGTLTRAVRINEKVIRTWSAILKAIPNAKLVINSSNYQNAVMCDLLADKFLQHGVTRESLQMGSSSPPWDVLRGIDIGLDCFPHNSGTTLFEMLYLGIPFVTLAGRPSVGRLGASILHGLGHVEWIADSEEEYIAKAVSLAGDLERLSELRRGLRAEMQASPLMDEMGFARAVEDAYREMWKRWCTA